MQRKRRSKMENLFSNAKANPLIRGTASDLEELWTSLGKPSMPEGPSTDVRGTVPSFISGRDLEGINGTDAETQAARYNEALELLLELTGIWNVGGNSWTTRWEQGSQAWQAYTEKSWDMALDHISNNLWDDFCDSM
jgi:hypothetical protein